MKIKDALGFGNNNSEIMISFVGGGGKTSSIFTLANELASCDMKVLITTTTAMYNPIGIKNPNIDILGEYVDTEGKLKGFSKEQVDSIFYEKTYDFILVEADGAKGLPIKAPASHEPVVPLATSIMIGVIGIDCYGKKIDNSNVHRPEIFADLTGFSYGEIIEYNTIIRLITSLNGLYKNCPKGAKKVLLLNKVFDSETENLAKVISCKVLEKCKDIDLVLIGAVQESKPIKELLKGGNS